MHLDMLHHVDALTWWEFFIEILDYAYARPQGKGVACEKLGISHFVDDKIEANARSLGVLSVLLLAQDTHSLRASTLQVLKSIFEDEVGGHINASVHWKDLRRFQRC